MEHNIQRLVFNSFGVNTYIVYDQSGSCIIVDPGCIDDFEQESLTRFISEKSLKPVMMINTHFHIDHIAGNSFVCGLYNLNPVCHAQSKIFWETAREFGSVLGIEVKDLIIPTHFVNEGDKIPFGSSNLEVIYTPGHADGSVCLINHHEKYVISGDVLFRDSIGRSDLPTGNYDLLSQSILHKLYALPDEYTVYPGHGPHTSIGYEKINNPFIGGIL